MKIEVGKRYLNREGEAISIVSQGDDKNHPFNDDEQCSYTADGMFYKLGQECPWDLLSEIVSEPAPGMESKLNGEEISKFVNDAIQAAATKPMSGFVIGPEACLTCRFARCGRDIGNRLECRSQSPVPDNTAGATSRARWPQVNVDDWCGDFDRIKPGQAA